MSGRITIETTDTHVTVISPYWRVRHSRREGMAPDGMAVLHATGKNMLTGAMGAFADAYGETNARHTKLNVEESKDCVVLTASGQMRDAEGRPGPFYFTHEYRYGLYIQKHTLTVTPGRETKIRLFSATRIPLDKRLDTYLFGTADFDKAKPRYYHILGPHYDDIMGGFGDENKVYECDCVRPWQIAVFKTGVEGLQWCGDSAEYRWNAFLGVHGRGWYTLEKNDRGVLIQISPLNSQDEVTFDRPVTLSWYTILPNVPAMGHQKIMDVAIATCPFPEDEQVAIWAGKGVGLITLHNDTDMQGYTDAYWHDGSFPPFKPDKMKELNRFIRLCHRHQMKIIPYFSGWELSPDTPEFFHNHQDWYAPARPNGNIRYTPSLQCGVYGALMCPDGGWGRFLTDYIRKCVSELGFDGYYLDWSSPGPCYNERHMPGQHNGADGLVDMLTSHRQWLGENGIIRIHSGGQLRWLLHDNIADHVVTFEEGVKGKRGIPDRLEDYPPTIAFMNACDTGVVPAVAGNQPTDTQPAQTLHKAMTQFVMLGALPYAHSGTEVRDFSYRDYREALNDPRGVYGMYERFKSYRLEDYKFYNGLSGLVAADRENTGAALYARPGEGLLIVSNMSGEQKRAIRVSIDPFIAAEWGLPETIDIESIGPWEILIEKCGRDRRS